MTELLDPESIDEALVSLPGWQRVENTLVKNVPVDAAAADKLEAAVMTAADELNHHPVIHREDGQLRFTVWTHSAGGVTDKDLRLAGHIDNAISGTA